MRVLTGKELGLLLERIKGVTYRHFRAPASGEITEIPAGLLFAKCPAINEMRRGPSLRAGDG